MKKICLLLCESHWAPSTLQRPLTPGVCHIFSHLGQSRKCHSRELLAASASVPSSTQNQSPVEAGGGREKNNNSVWLQVVFSARLVLLVAFGLAARAPCVIGQGGIRFASRLNLF